MGYKLIPVPRYGHTVRRLDGSTGTLQNVDWFLPDVTAFYVRAMFSDTNGPFGVLLYVKLVREGEWEELQLA